ncbi:MAG: hypothetical protein GX868_13800 [Actinobacteria bacterium]|nr:hypothetical protein [Actinomycetota bacterium]
MRPTTDTHRSIVGLVLLAVARTAYPEPAMMDDPDHIAVFTTNGVVDTLDRAVSLCLEDADPDGDADEDLYEAFRRWNDKRRTDLKSGKVTKTTKPGIVNSVCRFLVDAGHLTARGDTDGGTWSTRPRFRHAVIALSEDSYLYRLVNDLIDAEVAP